MTCSYRAGLFAGLLCSRVKSPFIAPQTRAVGAVPRWVPWSCHWPLAPGCPWPLAALAAGGPAAPGAWRLAPAGDPELRDDQPAANQQPPAAHNSRQGPWVEAVRLVNPLGHRNFCSGPKLCGERNGGLRLARFSAVCPLGSDMYANGLLWQRRCGRCCMYGPNYVKLSRLAAVELLSMFTAHYAPTPITSCEHQNQPCLAGP
jgi:hypothetical protein